MPVGLRLGNPDTIAASAPRNGVSRMSDARISTGLPSHPKTRKLIRRLGPASGWSLVCLFLWTASNRHDGDLSGLSGEDIELAADWAGDPGVFIAALCEVRFLDGKDGAYTVHDWSTHNPWAAAYGKRKESAVHAARMRWASESHAEVSKPQCPIPNHTYTKPNPKPEQASPAAPPARGTRLKADWWPSEATEGWVMDEHPHVSFDNQLAAFRDYWTAKPGKDGRKLDWDATFRNWIRNSRQTARAGPTAKPKTVAAYDAIGAKIDELSTVVPGRDRARIAGHDPA